MPPLHAPATLLTVPDVDMKGADDRADWRQVFLILRGGRRFGHRPSTRRTDRRDRCVIRLVDVRGNGPMGGPTIRRSRFAAGAPRVSTRLVLGKRRGLPSTRPARRLELVAEAFVLASQSVILPAQRIAFPLRSFSALTERLAVVWRWWRMRRPRVRHIEVMPDPPKTYKYKILDRSVRERRGEARTR